MNAQEPLSSRVRHSEELDAQIDELLELAAVRGAEIRRGNKGVVYRRTEDKPDIKPLLHDDLRRALEDEIVPAMPESPNKQIMDWEYHEEVIKKALVGLKLPALRKIARSNRLAVTGSREDLATAIGRFYRWNEEEVARLVLQFEEEPPADRGIVERLFPLEDEPNLEYVAERLEYVINRYIRIGIARWFVFDRMEESDGLLTLWGTVRSYQAHITVERDEETPGLTATATEHTAIAYITDSEKLLRIRNASAATARSCIKALNTAALLKPLGHVPNIGLPKGESVGFDRTALFMLDLLAYRLPATGLHSPNLTVAKFKVGEEVDEDEAVVRPTLRSVRFEGRYLLDSAPACKLLAEEGRALVDVSMQISSPNRPDGEVGRFPLRLAHETDHVMVSTSYGSDHPEFFPMVHRAAVAGVVDEIQHGLSDPDKLQELCSRIRDRAKVASPDRVDLLGKVTDPSAADQ